MSARETILAAVRTALPPAAAMPPARAHRDGAAMPSSLGEAFIGAAEAAGAVVVAGPRGELSRLLRDAAAKAERILSLVPELTSTTVPASLHALSDLTLFACEATLGVAENGAVWFATSDARHRAALFLAEEVVIVVAAESVVADLHDAYARIDLGAHSFGAFIAGPSKTADIEQSLVIGAHGPRTLTVILTHSAAALPPRGAEK
jgi:L-lactate dehydrogenase complex protein LldG